MGTIEGQLGIGLIGCGNIARWVHLRALQRLPGVRIVALADTDPDRLAAARQTVGLDAAAGYADPLALLQDPAVQAVVIATATNSHAALATAAFQAAKHVYLEKPLATDLAEGRAVQAAGQAAGTVGMIGFNYRFNPLLQALRQDLQAGRIGEVLAVRSMFTTARRTLPSWKQQRATGGGVLLDLASHHVDLLRYLFQTEIREVSAAVASRHSEADTATVQCRLATGILSQSFFSLCTAEDDRFEVFGTTGQLTVRRYDSVAVEYRGVRRTRGESVRGVLRAVARLPHLGYVLRRRRSAGGDPSYEAALAAFAGAIAAGRAVSPDLADGYRSLAVVLAAEESARTGGCWRGTEENHG